MKPAATLFTLLTLAASTLAAPPPSYSSSQLVSREDLLGGDVPPLALGTQRDDKSGATYLKVYEETRAEDKGCTEWLTIGKAGDDPCAAGTFTFGGAKLRFTGCNAEYGNRPAKLERVDGGGNGKKKGGKSSKWDKVVRVCWDAGADVKCKGKNTLKRMSQCY